MKTEQITRDFLGFKFQIYNYDELIAKIDSLSTENRFSYLVTPNVDHIQRAYGNYEMMRLYENASICINDSKVISLLSAIVGKKMPNIPGSDLTEVIFNSICGSQKKILIIGSDEQSIKILRQEYGLSNLHHYSPPMGLKNSKSERDKCVTHATKEKYEYTFICVGSPVQEMIAYGIKQMNLGSGIGLCIGASIDFIVGKTRRAPIWMRRFALEWLYRMLSEPRRLTKRYLVDFVVLIRIILKHVLK